MPESLAEALYFFRSASHVSQETLAERAGISTRTVSDIETGAVLAPRLITIMLLAEALGLSPSDRQRLQESAHKRAPRRSDGETFIRIPAPVLVGRDADAANLSALLAQGTRLVTLVGPAGVGKTSLAARVAADAACAYERGATIAELAPVNDPSRIPAAIARALRIRESSETPASDAVCAFLHGRSALLVLDNLEHLMPAVAWIGALLEACQRIAVLATSREPLHLRAEHVYPVRPLETASAVALFVQRAQMVKPDFNLTAGNARDVDTIVGRLEGLPLAIELAAPRLLMLAPKALAARLERRLPLLGSTTVDMPARQQTMRNAIAWSFDLLSQEEQRAFTRLSVLHGGGTLEAAAALAGNADESSILFRLAPLVDKNMIVLSEDADGEPRVSMLEMLREFGFERLTHSGELAGAQRRHAEYVLDFVRRSKHELNGPSQGRWVARFEREHANIRAALEWAARSGDVAYGCALIAAVWRFWWLHGYRAEGLEWVGRFIRQRSATRAEIPDGLYTGALRVQVTLLCGTGNFTEALAPCREAIALQRAIGDEGGLAASLTSLGIILQFRGEYDRALEAHTEALEIRRRMHDDAGIGNSLSNLASTAFSKNDLEAASSFGDESVSRYRRAGNESGLSHALMTLGLVASMRRKYDRAEQLFSESLRLQRAIGYTGGTYVSLFNLGSVAHKRGDHRLALARYREALGMFEAAPAKATLAKALEDFAITIAALGHPAPGARLLGAADALRRAIGSPLFPAERADYDTEVQAVRRKMGDEAFDAQWRIGTSLTHDRALEEARAAADRVS
ncbi:MAG: tetratricopeptide repeat protein [Candidatus Cybelea sp.]